MKILFKSKKLADSLNDKRRRSQEFGGMSNTLGTRLSALSWADSLEAMRNAPGRCHELHGNREGQLGITITGNYRLVLEPAHDPLPRKADGGLDWDRITAVRILEVTDYHGD